MSWFDRSFKGNPTEGEKVQGRYLRAAGVDRALEGLSGPYGLRRYVVFFQRQGEGVKLTGVVSSPLAWGGGPPRNETSPEAIQLLERALTSLHRNMGTGPRWDRGAVGVVRDKNERVHLFPLFDEDVDEADVDRLPTPDGPGHPLEDPAYRAFRAGNEAAFATVHAATAQVGADWVHWRIDGETLKLTYGDGRRLDRRARPFATVDPEAMTFTWAVEEPLFTEAPFVNPSFEADWEDAFELGLLTTARLGASWMFVGRVDAPSPGSLLLAAVRER